LEAIGNSLPVVFKRQVRRADAQLAELLAPLWARVAGKAVARHSRPVAFWSGRLTLAAQSETWAAQLRTLEAEILEAVNNFLGAPLAKELRVRLAPESERTETARAASTVGRGAKGPV
jgi:predicted nucleic acid-binding Zn ribbon protein